MPPRHARYHYYEFYRSAGPDMASTTWRLEMDVVGQVIIRAGKPPPVVARRADAVLHQRRGAPGDRTGAIWRSRAARRQLPNLILFGAWRGSLDIRSAYGRRNLSEQRRNNPLRWSVIYCSGSVNFLRIEAHLTKTRSRCSALRTGCVCLAGSAPCCLCPEQRVVEGVSREQGVGYYVTASD